MISWYALAQGFHNNSDVLVTIQPPFTDEGGCIVTETSEFL